MSRDCWSVSSAERCKHAAYHPVVTTPIFRKNTDLRPLQVDGDRTSCRTFILATQTLPSPSQKQPAESENKENAARRRGFDPNPSKDVEGHPHAIDQIAEDDAHQGLRNAIPHGTSSRGGAFYRELCSRIHRTKTGCSG